MLIKKWKFFVISFVVSLISCDSSDNSFLAYAGIVDQFAPGVVDFDASYIGEKRVEIVTVRNTSDRRICIETVWIYGSNEITETDEFIIESGWNYRRKFLDPGSEFELVIAFNPRSHGHKVASLNLYASDLVYDMRFTLRGLCCPPLKFKTLQKLPNAEEYIDYNLTFEAEGGIGNYTYTLDESTTTQTHVGKGFIRYIAYGLNFETNKLIGKPQESGSIKIGLILQDDAGHSTTKIFNLYIKEGKYAYLSSQRVNTDGSTRFGFVEGDNKGQYTVNLHARCKNRQLTVNTIELTGCGYDSGEAKITKMPKLPLRMANDEEAQIVISVESKLDEARDIELVVHHDGDNEEVREKFIWQLSLKSKFVFVMNRSLSMSKSMQEQPGYAGGNGNCIPYPSKWQAVQSEATSKIMHFSEHDSFDIVVFDSKVRLCFSVFKEADQGNKASAIGWIYNIGPSGKSTGLHSALQSAFKNYEDAQYIYFFTDKVLELDYKDNVFKFINEVFQMVRIYNDTKKWVNEKISKNRYFKFYITYFNPRPAFFMEKLGSLPNTSCRFVD